MKHCNSCNIDINTDEKVCPLCQTKLVGECTPIFPVPSIQKNSLILKILFFILLISVVATGYIDYTTNHAITYSLYALLGAATIYILFRYILMKARKDLIGFFFNILLLSIILLSVWYYFTRFSFITNYVIPGITIFDLVSSTIMALILKQKYTRKYIHIIIMNIFFGFIPVLLVLLKLSSDMMLAQISMILAVITIIGLILFDFNSLKEEISRMFFI